VFGLSFGELLVLLLVAIMVLGPKDLPRYLRKAGEFAGRLRRLAFDMREKSGIDEVLRAEGIDRDIAEIRRLARGEIGGVVAAVRSATDPLRPDGAPGATRPAALTEPAGPQLFEVQREYPPEGADAYGALPDTSRVYDGDMPASSLSDDPLYARGEEGPSAEGDGPPPAAAEAPS
jgi:sec-independent protein translocase protein TatB